MSTVQLNYRPAWVREDFIDFVLRQFNPMLTWTAVKAKVVGITPLPDDMVEVQLKPNRHFRHHQAGQFVFLTVQINGVHEQRAYSIVNAPIQTDPYLTLAVKVQGKVSGYLATKLALGDIISISQPQGEFVVTPHIQQALLFIAAGSGITPIISMITEQLMSSSNTPVTLLYISRDPAYIQQLQQLAQAFTQFTLHIIQDSTDKPARFGQDMLDSIGIVPENYQTYLCGAPGLMHAVNTLWNTKGIAHYLKQERFVAPTSSHDAKSFRVNFRQKQRSFEATGNLLTSAENAGLNPASGCRMGICNTCVCQKVAGTVRNQLTQEVSNRPNEAIKLCISEALSPLEIDA